MNAFLRLIIDSCDESNHEYPEKKSFWAFLIFFVLVLCALGVLHGIVNEYLDFDRELIVSGQWWRLLSAHVVHLNVNHMLMNVAGIMLGTVMFAPAVRVWQWYAVLCCCALGVSLGLLLFDKQLENYVGLSGALYGLLAFGLLMNIKRSPWLSIILYAYIHYKALDQLMPGFDSNYLRDVIGGYVVATAHLYGLVMGNILGVVFLLMRRVTMTRSD